MAFQLNLPPALEAHREALLQTKCTFIRIKAMPARDTKYWESKVGGIPYLPKGAAYPLTPDGEPLHFLAQINFEEVPKLDPFPAKGILQFYIYDDDLYGMDFDDGENPDTFRVIYYPEVVKDAGALQTDINMERSYDELPHHPDESYPLAFSLGEEIVPVTDYQFWKVMGTSFFQQFGEQEWEVLETYNKAVHAQGHKIGGYAYFMQDDPRKPEDPMLLLFQLDSDEGMDLMWGDMGVGHFFIRENDLKNLNFSKVLYDWDCC